MIQIDKRAAAVALARRGFAVFKLVENGKHPLAEGWPEQASADPDLAHRRWTCPVSGEALHNNIGIHTAGMEVLDPDMKRKHEGIDGLASLDELVDTYGLDTRTFTVATPTGGRHLYYRLPEGEQVRNSVDQIAPGIDVRGYRGFVVAPGSTINGVPYEIVNDTAPIEAPRWLIKAAGRPTPKADNAGVFVVEPDLPAAVERATKYLLDEAPISAHPSANNTLFRVAARVKDFGISEQTTRELIFEHYFPNDRCEVVWPDDQAIKVISNAYRHGKEPIGVASTEEFGEAEIIDRRTGQPAEQPKPKPRLHYVTFEESSRLALVEGNKPLIKGLLDWGAFSVMYGASNVGKTFVALDLAFHVAAGLPWRGRSTTKAAAVYVAAEAGRGIHRRVAALRQHYAAEIAALEARGESVTLSIVPCPIDLRDDKGDTEALIGLIKAAVEAMGAPAGLVVVDTLSRAIAGGDENSSVDMGAFVKHVDRLRVATGAHTKTVHHSGKDAAKGARGHSLLRAATDTEIEVGDGKISVTKQREMEGGQKIGFRLKEVLLGTDPDGDLITSCVLGEAAVDDDGLPALTEEEKKWDDDIVRGLEKMSEERGEIISKCLFGTDFLRSLWHEVVHLTLVRKPLSKQGISKRMMILSTKGRYKKVNKTQWVRIVSTVSTAVHF
jgi:hypothetical protein